MGESGSRLVKDLMNGVLLSADVDENLAEIIRLLHENNADAIIVRQNGAPKGIIAASDIIKCLATTDKLPKEILAKEVMRTPIVAIEHDADRASARDIMVNQSMKMLPVKMEYDIIGVLTPNDLM